MELKSDGVGWKYAGGVVDKIRDLLHKLSMLRRK
jgi:hypothetical protein